MRNDTGLSWYYGAPCIGKATKTDLLETPSQTDVFFEFSDEKAIVSKLCGSWRDLFRGILNIFGLDRLPHERLKGFKIDIRSVADLLPPGIRSCIVCGGLLSVRDVRLRSCVRVCPVKNTRTIGS